MTKSVSTTHGIVRGDLVRILSGDDRGKQGKVLKVVPLASRVVVEGVNIAIRHTRSTAKVPHGGRIETPAPINLSNVQLICPNCSKPTKVVMKGTGAAREATCAVCQNSLVRKARS